MTIGATLLDLHSMAMILMLPVHLPASTADERRQRHGIVRPAVFRGLTPIVHSVCRLGVAGRNSGVLWRQRRIRDVTCGPAFLQLTAREPERQMN